VAKVQVAAHKYSWKIFKSCIWNIFQRNAVGDFWLDRLELLDGSAHFFDWGYI